MARSLDPIASAIPWLGPGPVRTCNQRAAAALMEALGRLRFDVRELEGERIVVQESFAGAFRRLFGFPEGTGDSWDEMAAVPVERLERPPGERAAIVWHRADHSAFFCLKCVVEASWFVFEWSRRLGGARDDGPRVELVLLGHTRDYPQPPPGWIGPSP